MFGTCVAETILASVHVRTQQQAGHMDASDLVKLSRDILQVGAVHIWGLNFRRPIYLGHFESNQLLGFRVGGQPIPQTEAQCLRGFSLPPRSGPS
jgi:hypothetical protein